MKKEQQNKTDRLVPFGEAAERIGCTRDSLHNLCRRIGLRKFKFPGHVRARGLLESDIDALLKFGKENSK